MLVIRLARGGRKKYPVYRIVAADQRRAATGKFVAVLGHYNPHTKDLVIKKDELKTYIDNGAQPSNAVLKLMKHEKITLPKWTEIKTRERKPKSEPEQVDEKVAEVASEKSDVTEAKAEQVADASGTVAEAEQAEANKVQQDAVAEAVIDESKAK